MNTVITISLEETGERLDKILVKRFPDHSRSFFQHVLNNGFVSNTKVVLKKQTRPKCGDEITIKYDSLPEPSIIPEDIPLSILYEDDEILAIDKPSGLVVHPGVGHPCGTLVNALMFYLKSLPETDDPLRPGIVHRLDKETSGVIITAKTRRSHERLVDAFKNREVEKEYLAITEHVPASELIDLPIGRHRVHRERMAVVVDGGKDAVTGISVLETNGREALVLAKPKTGRTHQIRVHLKHVGARIVGDSHYGSRFDRADRTMLHAFNLKFYHPVTKKFIELNSPIPDDFAILMKKLTFNPEFTRKI